MRVYLVFKFQQSIKYYNACHMEQKHVKKSMIQLPNIQGLFAFKSKG